MKCAVIHFDTSFLYPVHKISYVFFYHHRFKNILDHKMYGLLHENIQQKHNLYLNFFVKSVLANYQTGNIHFKCTYS